MKREEALESLATLLVGVTADGRRVYLDGREEERKPARDETCVQDLCERRLLVQKRAKVLALLDVVTRNEG